MQIVDPAFTQTSQGELIPVDYDFTVAFDKQFDPNITWFTYDVSQYNGGDLYAPTDDNELQEWDKYKYTSYKNRIVTLDYSRSIDFPYSVQSAIADVTLDNYDDLFTPFSDPTLGQYMIPKRPLRLYSGYQGVGLLSQFVGLSQSSPQVDDDTKIASITAMDFLSEIFELPLNTTVAMRDAYTGEVIEVILQQFGLLPTQYNIARGRNRIPFVFFEKKNIKAGEVLRRLMQAEMGNLWLDEQGIIRFEPRLMNEESPVMTFNESNILNIESTGDAEIINKVLITAPLREVQEFQPVWTKTRTSSTSSLHVIPAMSSREITVSLSDPCYSIVPPTQGYASNVSWFVATRPDGSEVPSNVTVISDEVRTNSYVMTFANTNNFDVNIEEAEVWGEPAKEYDVLEYENSKDDSVAIYGEQTLEISNDFFQTYDNCRSFAITLLDSYANYAGIIKMDVMGNPALQLGDIIQVNSDPYTDTYKIISIVVSLPEKFTIQARRYSVREWFTYDVSQYNSTNVYAP